MLNDSAQRKTNPKREMTHCVRTQQPYSIHYIVTVYTTHKVTSFRKTETGFCEV